MPSLPDPTIEEYTTAVTLPRAGELLGVSADTIARMLAAGELPYVRVRGKRRIRLVALRHYLDAQDARVTPFRRMDGSGRTRKRA